MTDQTEHPLSDPTNASKLPATPSQASTATLLPVDIPGSSHLDSLLNSFDEVLTTATAALEETTLWLLARDDNDGSVGALKSELHKLMNGEYIRTVALPARRQGRGFPFTAYKSGAAQERMALEELTKIGLVAGTEDHDATDHPMTEAWLAEADSEEYQLWHLARTVRTALDDCRNATSIGISASRSEPNKLHQKRLAEWRGKGIPTPYTQPAVPVADQELAPFWRADQKAKRLKRIRDYMIGPSEGISEQLEIEKGLDVDFGGTDSVTTLRDEDGRRESKRLKRGE